MWLLHGLSSMIMKVITKHFAFIELLVCTSHFALLFKNPLDSHRGQVMWSLIQRDGADLDNLF